MKEYTIGLDIGTNSVGWAVLDENGNLIRKKMRILGNTETKYKTKNFWGSLLFTTAEKAEARRQKRTARRRYRRRRYRLVQLQEIFREEIEQIDPNFFPRLDQTFLVPQDKEFAVWPVFGNGEEERAYHQQYPTIYHLREALANQDQKADPRLVYLALAHILKYRGNFSIEGELDLKNLSVQENSKAFLLAADAYDSLETTEEEIAQASKGMEDILTGQARTRSEKEKAILALFPAMKKNPLFQNLIKLACGLQGDFQKALDLPEKTSLDFASKTYEEDLEKLTSLVDPELLDLIEKSYALYSAVVLSRILSDSVGGRAPFSSQMVLSYQRHQEDLKELKAFMRRYFPNPSPSEEKEAKKSKSWTYDAMFKDIHQKGYASYIDGGAGGEQDRKVDQKELYKTIRSAIASIPKLEESEEAKDMLEKMDREVFLPKQRSIANREVPVQIHQKELEAILEKQGKYYPFLEENAERIKKLLRFRIPYYVGPLDQGQSSFAWIQRKKEDKITPFNFEEVVDLDASAARFMDRLISYDQYLGDPEKKVLPKQSLLYQKFAVFNELTKIRYVDEQGREQNFSAEMKREIFDQLFKHKQKVTRKHLEKFLENHYHLDQPQIQGIEEAFNSSFSTYIAFSRIPELKEILEEGKADDVLEDIVRILTVFEDYKMRKKQLFAYRDLLSSKTIDALAKIHYTGWGRLSKELIHGLRDQATQKTILDFLQEDDAWVGPKDQLRHQNRNFMQLIRDEGLSFRKTLEEAMEKRPMASLLETVEDLPASPAVKKGIYLSLRLVEEIIHILGQKPRRIVLEMAREDQTTDQGRKQAQERKKRIEDGLKAFAEEAVEHRELTSAALRSDRLYLYYTQNGRDMYTGEPLDLSALSSYDIDHIIPKSIKYDDSIDNRVLTNRVANSAKADRIPSLDIVRKQKAFWQRLLDAKLISQRKFASLTRAEKGPFTDAEKEGFLHRQLVETRQITKHVAAILDRYLDVEGEDPTEKEKTDLVLTKAQLVSQFRDQFQLFKIRDLNDYHHAHDAYLNAFLASKLLAMYPWMEKELVYGKFLPGNRRGLANKATRRKATMANAMDRLTKEQLINEEGEIFWDKEKDLARIIRTLNYRQLNVVYQTQENRGELFNQTIFPVKSKPNTKIKGKHQPELDVTKYGGYTNVNASYFLLIAYPKKKKRAKDIIRIAIMDRKEYEEDPQAYFARRGLEGVEVLKKIKINSLFELENGARRYITGARSVEDGKVKGLGNLIKANQMAYTVADTSTLASILKHGKSEFFANVLLTKEEMKELQILFQRILAYPERYNLRDTDYQNLKNRVDSMLDNPLTYAEAARSIQNIFIMSKRGAYAAFTIFGKSFQRNQETSIFKVLQGTLINLSLTGLYETRERMDLL